MLNLSNDNHEVINTREDIFQNQLDSSIPFALFQNKIINVNNHKNHKS